MNSCGDKVVFSLISGIIFRPSICLSVGKSTLTMSATVGYMSISEVGSSVSLPGDITPGHRIIPGTLIPPSGAP